MRRIPPLLLLLFTIQWIDVSCFVIHVRPHLHSTIGRMNGPMDINVITKNSNTLPSSSSASSTASTCLYNSWQSHVSTHPLATYGLEKVLGEVTGGDTHDIGFLFVGQAHADYLEKLVELASPRFKTLISIVGAGVVGERVELDDPNRPCLSLLTGNLPDGANVECFAGTEAKGTEDLIRLLGDDDDGDGSYLLLADPWSGGVQTLMDTLTKTGSVVAGGISCGTSSIQPSIGLNDRVLPPSSVLGVRFSGTIGLQTLVAQGCRPIGGGFTVTEVENGTIITKLNDKPAVQSLQDLLDTATPKEREQIENGLLCGLAPPGNDDYLCRQIVGLSPKTGGIAIGSPVQTGNAFCFQVRDSDTARQDIQLMVQRARTTRLFEGSTDGADTLRSVPLAALQISCVARGRGFFGTPNVDLASVQELVDGPVAGFYANGEIGPVGISGFQAKGEIGCFLHGFTTVAAILCERRGGSEPTSLNDDPMMDAWG